MAVQVLRRLQIRAVIPRRKPDRHSRERGMRLLGRAFKFVPIGAATVAAALALALIADQQTASIPPFVVEAVDLPTAGPPKLIDLNTATAAELATLPGIGETRARAIIRARERASFVALTDLVERGILRASQLAAVAEQAAVYVTFD